MLKPGIYRHCHDNEYADGTVVHGGEIVLEVHETKTAFVLCLMEQGVRYDAPQIDDMFRKSKRVLIKKNGSKHAMTFCDNNNEWFCLYPYRVGVPYSFEHEDSIKRTTDYVHKLHEKKVDIDVSKDFLVKSGEVKTVETAGTPYSGAAEGDKYIDFVINVKSGTAADEHMYLPVNSLVDTHNAGEKYIHHGELCDEKIVDTLHQTAEDYENGELIEVRDTLLNIVSAIDEFSKYGDAQ